MIANLVGAGILFGKSILSRPPALLQLPGGTFQGIDICSNTVPGSLSTTGPYNINAIYRHDRIANVSSFEIVKCVVSSGIMIFISSGTNNLVARAYNGTGYYDTGNIALTVGTIYDIKVTGNSVSTLTLLLNGVSYNLIYRGLGTNSTQLRIGTTNLTGTGKLSKLTLQIDTYQMPEFIPAIYGVSGTSDCGNGWTLTDGSPATFWT